MKKHTRATPAGIPRSRASTVRRLRLRGDMPSFGTFMRLTHMSGFTPVAGQKYGSHRRGPESRRWRWAGPLDLTDVQQQFMLELLRETRQNLEDRIARDLYNAPGAFGPTAAPLNTARACTWMSGRVMTMEVRARS